MNPKLKALHDAMQLIRTSSTYEALSTSIRQILSQLMPTITTVITAFPLDQAAIDSLSTLGQAAHQSTFPQISDDELQFTTPMLRDNHVVGIIEVLTSQPITLAMMTTIVATGRMLADRVELLTWPLSPNVYRQIVDKGAIPFDVVDTEYRLTYMNDAALRMYGFTSREEVRGMLVSELYLDSRSVAALNHFDTPVDEDRRWMGDVLHKDKDGHPIPLQAVIFPLRDPRSKETYSFGAFKMSLHEQNALLESLEKQARRLEAAVIVARVTNVQRDLDSLLREVMLATYRLFDYEMVAIGVIGLGQVQVKAILNNDGSPAFVSKVFDIDKTSITGYVAVTGETYIADDVSHDPFYQPQQETPAIRSELALPIKVGGRLLGTFSVGSRIPDAYGASEVETIRGIADQVAVAIENLSLLSAQQRRVQELSIVNAISHTLIASSYDLEALWEPIASYMQSLFNVSTFYVSLYDEASHTVRFAYLKDKGQVIEIKEPLPVTGLSKFVLRDGKPTRFDDLHKMRDDLLAQDIHPFSFGNSDRRHTRSWLGVPLVARDGSTLGIVSVQSYEPYAFNEGDERLLTTIAALVSLTLENSRLFTRLRYTATWLEKRTKRLEQLSRLGSILSSSLNRDEVLARAAKQVVKLMEIDHCGIVIVDRTREIGVVVAEHPDRGLLNSDIPLRGNPIYELQQTGDVIIFDTAVEQGELKDLLISQGIQVMISARIYGKDRLLGSIGLDMMENRREFTDEDRDLFRIIVHQVALAVDNTDLYRQALATNELKSQFLANMSHELRTPMNAIIGYTEMVLAGIYGGLTPTQQDRLQRVYGNAKHLLDLINDVLDLSRIETGHMKLDIVPVDVVPLIVGAIGNVAPMAEAKRLRISIELPKDEIIVHADPVRLRQVTLNLLGNAVKFTREGGVTVRVTKFTKRPDERLPIMPDSVELPAGEWLAIAIIDTGIGIARKNFDLIFEAFQQVDSSTIREFAGTGLGLSICKQLMELHHGYVWVDSQLGVGSVFTMVLPARLPSDNR